MTEKIWNQFSLINDLINTLKAVFIEESLKKIFSHILLPLKPITTWLCIQLDTATFYCKDFNEIKKNNAKS